MMIPYNFIKTNEMNTLLIGQIQQKLDFNYRRSDIIDMSSMLYHTEVGSSFV